MSVEYGFIWTTRKVKSKVNVLDALFHANVLVSSVGKYVFLQFERMYQHVHESAEPEGLKYLCVCTYSLPFVVDVLDREVGVGVLGHQLDPIGLGNLQDLGVDAQGGHALLVGLGQGSLKLIMGCDQTLLIEKRRQVKR